MVRQKHELEETVVKHLHVDFTLEVKIEKVKKIDIGQPTLALLLSRIKKS